MTDHPTDITGGDRIEPVDRSRRRCSAGWVTTPCRSLSGERCPTFATASSPLHRKILYGMYDSGFHPDRNFVKCGHVVGDVMGNYHPHGNTALYDALVRMAQTWSLRYPLIDPGQLRLARQ